MLKAPSEFIILFIIISVLLILAMAVFISAIIYRYQQKQNAYFKDIESLKTFHQNTLLKSQLEIQEQTFQNISREIHDNIGQKLTLAKLYLNTLNSDKNKATLQLNDSVYIIGEAINNLKDLSRSMNSENLLSNGLINALESEKAQLIKSGMYQISFSATGNPVFLDTATEVVLFRIVQEALNNIVKHANASIIDINLHYTSSLLTVNINDNGNGFNITEKYSGSGLLNIKKRAIMLKGNVTIQSTIGVGTKINLKIPLDEINKAL